MTEVYCQDCRIRFESRDLPLEPSYGEISSEHRGHRVFNRYIEQTTEREGVLYELKGYSLDGVTLGSVLVPDYGEYRLIVL